MALTQVSTGGIKDGQVQTADLADSQVTAAKLHADALDRTYTLGADGNNHYTFTGEGLTGAVNDPTLYLTRGKTYRFVNGNSAGAHPFRIQTTVNGSAGTEYNTGVTNNGGAGGSTIIFEVPHAAPDVLYYQCTSHGSMGGILYVTGALADGTVTTAKIADANVTTAKLADDAVTAAKIGTGAVEEAKIQAFAVTETKIGDQAVTLAKLPHGTSSNDGKFLRANNGADPTFESLPSSGLSNVVEDTTPQLGGNLETNSNDILFADNDSAKFGAGTDLELFHDPTSSNSVIKHQNENGHLRILSGVNGNGGIQLKNRTDAETYLTCISDGGVELYHDNSKKIETTSIGATVTGTVSQTVLPSWGLRPNGSSDSTFFPHSNFGHTIGWSDNTSGSSAKACHLSGGCTLSAFSGSPVGNGYNIFSGSSTGKLTVPLAGKYYVFTKLRMENTPGASDFYMYVNGTIVAREYTSRWNVRNYESHSIETVLDLAANDYIEIVVHSNNGVMRGYNDNVNWFCGHYIA